jgi:UDP:flavonoid glycosyltransferase YjiC (YdhE family)
MARSYPIAKALVENGYDIRYYETSSNALVESRFKDIGVYPISDKYKIKFLKKEDRPKYSSWYNPEEFCELIGYNDIEWLENTIDELIYYIKQFSPDYIFSDISIISSIASRILNIPLISVTQSCYHPNMSFSRLRWWEEPREVNLTLFDNVNKLFAKKGVKKINSFEELFIGDLTIIPSSPEFDPIEDLNKYNTFYVGPILYDNLDKTEENTDDLFLSDNTIFCYTGRFFDHVGEGGFLVLKSVLHALMNTSLNLIISTGSESDKIYANNYLSSINLGSLNVKIKSWVPMSTAYENSNMIIHHGGHGSALAQILFKTPSLIIPTHSEREYNAMICQKLNISEVESPKNINLKSISEKVSKLLEGNPYKEKLEILNEILKKHNYNGANDVVNLIEKM